MSLQGGLQAFFLSSSPTTGSSRPVGFGSGGTGVAGPGDALP